MMGRLATNELKMVNIVVLFMRLALENTVSNNSGSYEGFADE